MMMMSDELFLWNGWPTECVQPYFQLVPFSEVFVIGNSDTSRAGFESAQKLRGSYGREWNVDEKYNFEFIVVVMPGIHRPPQTIVRVILASLKRI